MGTRFPQKEANVKCPICRIGETRPGKASSLLERDGAILVFKHVPAEVCENCSEEYVSEDTATRLLDLAEGAVRSGVRVSVREYSTAVRE
jgi:YgiT-type zinc finger domain-containing protein